LDAQLFVDLGFGKSTGLKNIQASDTIIGTRDHHPIQTRLQKAKIINGNAEYLVHTLHGLACFIQLSSVRLKILAILFSSVIFYHFSIRFDLE